MRKEAVFVLLFIFLEGNMIISSVYTNPVALDPFYTGQITPLSESSVYFKAEEVSVNISERVDVLAIYILKNSENRFTNLSVALPFAVQGIFDYSLPENVSLGVNATPKDYIWTAISFNSTSGLNNTHSAIAFNLSFSPFEEKVVIANYSRHYTDGETDVRRVYTYMTETGRFWNRSIEHAVFNLRIDLTCAIIPQINGLEDYSCIIDLNSHDWVITKEFFNWSPTENIAVIIDLTSLRIPEFVFPFLLAFLGGVLCFIFLRIKVTERTNHTRKDSS